MFPRRLSILLPVVLFCTAAHAQKAADLVQAQLIADTTHIEPGKTFRAAVRFTIAPDWHIYWKHPGETGLPTTVKLDLPEGFTTAPVLYPVPKLFDQFGQVTGYGYGEEVLLLIDITAPEKIDGSTVSFNGRASFLVCEKVCIPGSSQLSLTLPVGTAAPSSDSEHIASWSAKLPKHAEPKEVTGALAAAGTPVDFSVTVPLEGPVTDLQWFAQTPDALSLTDSALTSDETSATICFKAKVLSGFELKNSTLPILVAYTDSHGVRGGVELDVPLRKAE